MNEYRQEILGLPEQLRRELRELLPPRAFLRRDRGDALYVTDAPRFADARELCAALETAGFCCEPRREQLAIFPGVQRLIELERRCPPPNFFCASLMKLRGLPPCEDALKLFAVGVRLLEHPEKFAYARHARQLAALCLRTRSGGAYACALIDFAMREET